MSGHTPWRDAAGRVTVRVRQARAAFRLNYQPGMPEAEKQSLWAAYAPLACDAASLDPHPEGATRPEDV